MKKVFIDGSSGTTGLKIFNRLSVRDDIKLIVLSDDERKDTLARKNAINSADIVFLCLPDDASREAVGLCENKKTVIIDTSTAHRTAEGWTYGFPEIVGKNKIAKSKRIANPGCHASGFVALVAPLVKSGVIKKSAHLSCFSLTGYSGGGKKMIAEYEDANRPSLYSSPRLYALSQTHKHLAEMKCISGLKNEPNFMPVVASYYSGMQVIVPLSVSDLKIENGENPKDCLAKIYEQFYSSSPVVRYSASIDENGFISSSSLSQRDDMLISVQGNKERLTLIALFDNLGKGASGSAIQNMNICLRIDETLGLNIG